jgi:DNA-binding protein YbaB
MEDEVERLMREFRERRARAGQLQRQIAAISGTATAKRQAVKVTVGVQGNITALEFPTGAYKRMPPAELSEAILATAAAARQKALDNLSTLMVPLLPNGLNYLDLIQGKADTPSALPAEPPMSDEVRAYIATGRVPGAGHE